MFKLIHDATGTIKHIETTLHGRALLFNSYLNKGCAFNEKERSLFGLHGLLPHCVETLAMQKKRCYEKFLSYNHPLNRYIYLNTLFLYNQTLYYALIQEHLEEMLPIIYTPTIGDVVKQFSHTFSQDNSLYFNYPRHKTMQETFNNRTNQSAKVMIVTDGQAVLGIGDQGVGGMMIATAKLSVYTICGGINPHLLLPACFDIGTDNQTLLDDPLYLGWRKNRISTQKYDAFADQWIKTLKKNIPDIFLHWEDFGVDNASRFLNKYRTKICTFNDDIQGTGAVTLATVLAATRSIGTPLTQQRIVLFGAGTAGIGIIEQINQAMKRQGLDNSEAQFWCIDRQGLLTNHTSKLTAQQKPFARNAQEVAHWPRDAQGQINLEITIHNAQPTMLIGCSTVAGAFTEPMIKSMMRYCDRPIIMPLSNPTEHAEAKPQDLYQWTDGNALIATGSPFPPVVFKGKNHNIPQCNNAYIFPGLGLGTLIAKAKYISDEMLWAACEALSQCAPTNSDGTLAHLLPPMQTILSVSKKVARAVAKTALAQGLSRSDPETINIDHELNYHLWEPKYYPLKRVKTICQDQ
jgi:malate dehydrogenase (oxaloacetate-decarboxylating)